MEVARAGRDLVLHATDVQYPLSVHIPHALISVARYRRWRGQEGQPRQWLYDLVLSFYSHSQGGGAGAKALLEGKSVVSYIARADYTYCQLLAWLAVYWSPLDVVYRTLATPRHPLRLACVLMDAVDAITTVCAVADKAREVHPRNALLPVMSGALVYCTGTLFRWCDARGRGKQVKSFLAEPCSGVTRGALLGLAYSCLGRSWRGGRHRDAVLVSLSLFEVLLQLAEDVFDFDAFAGAHRPFAFLADLLRRRLRLGDERKSGP